MIDNYNLVISYRADVKNSPKLNNLFMMGLNKRCSYGDIFVYTK